MNAQDTHGLPTGAELDLSKYDGHTPGPWLRFADTNVIICLHSGSAHVESLRICEVATNTRHDEGRHNGDLIIDAPLLLAACKRQADTIDRLTAMLGNLRASFRVNMLRYGPRPGIDAEIDRVLNEMAPGMESDAERELKRLTAERDSFKQMFADADQDRWRLKSELAANDAALRELVACKDLKERIDAADLSLYDMADAEHANEMQAEYDARKPLAWTAARAALTATQPDPRKVALDEMVKHAEDLGLTYDNTILPLEGTKP